MPDRSWMTANKLQLQQRVAQLEIALQATEKERDTLKEALDRSSADWTQCVTAKHTAETERDQALESLRKYGDHRWKCPVAKYLREYDSTSPDAPDPVCDCGWREVAAALPPPAQGGNEPDHGR